MQYHPDPRRTDASDRKVMTRFDHIRARVDFKDKTVLDLGCSGGFFSFNLAQEARMIYAIDGDLEIIRRNMEIQLDLGIKNIEFIHGVISKELIESIGPVDVTLFLSVYHHMLSLSDAYEWNDGMNSHTTDAVINAISSITDTLVFEIGDPNEGYEWCARLPRHDANWDAYVFDNVFRGRYKAVEVSTPPFKMNRVLRYIASSLSTPYKEDTWLIGKIKRLLGFDPRDSRKIYIGRKVSAQEISK